MEVTFWGVRGTIPAPGPATVRYGGNTSCVTVQLPGDELIIIDCGTGARALGLALAQGPFGRGEGRASLLLSHPHWDHIQGFPFFAPFYVAGNRFDLYGGAADPQKLEEILELQMAAQYFPVQSLRNMGGRMDLHAVEDNQPFAVGAATVRAHPIPHGVGQPTALAFRIEHEGHVLAYASDAGYGPQGPDQVTRQLFAGADLLIHDCSFTPEDQAEHPERGLSSLNDAIDAGLVAKARRLALFHFDQDYTDHDVDGLVARGRRELDRQGGSAIELLAATEGVSLRI